jgi:hypothetical protein
MRRAARGIALSVELRQRIVRCRDGAVIKGWIGRAIAAASGEDATPETWPKDQ